MPVLLGLGLFGLDLCAYLGVLVNTGDDEEYAGSPSSALHRLTPQIHIHFSISIKNCGKKMNNYLLEWVLETKVVRTCCLRPPQSPRSQSSIAWSFQILACFTL